MDFIDKLILPESLATLNLLSVLLLLGRIFFLSYSGVLFAGTVLSVMNINKQRQSHSNINLSFEFINLAAFNRLTPLGLGLIPFVSIVLIMIQILHQTKTVILEYLFVSFVLYILSMSFLYLYRMIINKSTNYSPNSDHNETHEPVATNSQIGLFPIVTGWISAILMFASLVIFSVCFSGLEDAITWQMDKSFTELFLSLHTILYILKYLFFAFSFTSILMIYKLQLKQRNENTTYIYNHSIALMGWISVLILTFINIFTLPDNSITISIILLTALTTLIMIVQIHLMIDNATKFEYKKSVYVFILAILLFSSMNIIDHSSFAIASGKQFYNLSANYQKTLAENEHTANGGTKINGKEIYTTKCMACHAFDKRVVGPPHKLVLTKYADKKEAMIQFVLKPVKVDPAYPDMPQQGLTPSEAKAVIEFMYKEYGNKLK